LVDCKACAWFKGWPVPADASKDKGYGDCCRGVPVVALVNGEFKSKRPTVCGTDPACDGAKSAGGF